MLHIGTSSSKLQNIKVGFYPESPQAGDDMTIYLNGTLCEFILKAFIYDCNIQYMV